MSVSKPAVDIFWARFMQMGGSRRYTQILKRLIYSLKVQPKAPVRKLTANMEYQDAVALPAPTMERLNNYCMYRNIGRSSAIRQAVLAGLYKGDGAPGLDEERRGRRTPTASMELTKKDLFLLKQELMRPANFGLTVSDLIRRAISKLPLVKAPKDLSIRECRVTIEDDEVYDNFWRTAQAMELTLSDCLRSFVYLACSTADIDICDPLRPYIASFLSKPLKALVPPLPSISEIAVPKGLPQRKFIFKTE